MSHDDRVGRCSQAMITRDRCHDSQIPDEAEDGNDAEYDGYDVTEHPADPAVHTDVCRRVGLVGLGRVGRPVHGGTRVAVGRASGLHSLRGGHYRVHDA